MQARRSQSSTSMYHDTYLQKLSNLVKVNRNTYRRPYSQCQRTRSNVQSKEQKREKPLPISQHAVLNDSNSNVSIEEKINAKPVFMQYNNRSEEFNSNQNKSAGALNRISRSTSFSSQHSDAIAFHYYNERRRQRMHLKQMRANKYNSNVSNCSEGNAWNDKNKGVYDMYGAKKNNESKACDIKSSKKTDNCKIEHILHTELRAIKRQKQRENALHENGSNVNNNNFDQHTNHPHVSLQWLPRRMSRHEQFMLYKVVNTNANASHPDINTSSDVNSAQIDNDNYSNNNNNMRQNNNNNTSCNSTVDVNDPLFMQERTFVAMPESDRYVCLLMTNLLLRCNRLESQEILQSLMRCVERKRLLRQYVNAYTPHSAKPNNHIHNQSEQSNYINFNIINNENKESETKAVCNDSNAEISSLYSLHSPCAIAGKESLIRVLQSKQRLCKSEPITNELESEQICELNKQNELLKQEQQRQRHEEIINSENNASVDDKVNTHVNALENETRSNNVEEEMETTKGKEEETMVQLENAQTNEESSEETHDIVKQNQEIVEHICHNDNNTSKFNNNLAENDIGNIDRDAVKSKNTFDDDHSNVIHSSSNAMEMENKKKDVEKDDENEDDDTNDCLFNGAKATLLRRKKNKEHEKQEYNDSMKEEELHKWKDTQRPHPLSVNDIANAMTNGNAYNEWEEEQHHREWSPVLTTSSSSSSLQQPQIHHVDHVEYVSEFYPTPEMLLELDERELSPGAAAARQAYLQAHPELLSSPSTSHVNTSHNDESPEEQLEEEKLEELEDQLEEVEEEEEFEQENSENNCNSSNDNDSCEEEFQRPQRRYGEIVSQNRRLGSSDVENNFLDNENVLNSSHNDPNEENNSNDDNDDDNCISFSTTSKSQESSDYKNSEHESVSENETNMETLSQREQYDFTLPAANSIHIPFVESNDDDDSYNHDVSDNYGNNNADDNNANVEEKDIEESQSIKSSSDEKLSDKNQVNVESNDVLTIDAEEDVLLPWEEEE